MQDDEAESLPELKNGSGARRPSGCDARGARYMPVIARAAQAPTRERVRESARNGARFHARRGEQEPPHGDVTSSGSCSATP